jgi:hypothetical protein
VSKVCDREASIMRRLMPTRGCCAIKKIVLVIADNQLLIIKNCPLFYDVFCPKLRDDRNSKQTEPLY